MREAARVETALLAETSGISATTDRSKRGASMGRRSRGGVEPATELCCLNIGEVAVAMGLAADVRSAVVRREMQPCHVLVDGTAARSEEAPTPKSRWARVGLMELTDSQLSERTQSEDEGEGKGREESSPQRRRRRVASDSGDGREGTGRGGGESATLLKGDWTYTGQRLTDASVQ